MQILIINWRDIRHPQAGGAEVHVHEIFRRLAASGDHVTLLSSRAPGQKQHEVVDGINTIRVGNWKNFNLVAAGYYLRRLRKIPWDIVVDDVNKIPFYTPLYVRRPILMLVPHLFGTTVFSEVSFPQAAYVFLWERAVPLVYARTPVVAISASTKRDLVERGLDSERITVVQCGIDHQVYRPTLLKHQSSSPVFVYLGRLKRYKNIDTLLEATAILKDRHPQLMVAVAGEGDDLVRLKKKAATLAVHDQVRFLGRVSLEKKINLLQDAYAMIVPSPKEGWGLTAIEANACGTPVLASKSPGLVDSVKHGQSGLHVPHGDSAALAEAMEKLMRDTKLRKHLSEGALQWADNFDWEKTARLMREQLDNAAGATS